MKTQTTISILLVIVAFAIFATAQKCEDRMEAKTCQYFIKIYGKKNIDVCKWKHMRTNCALTCKICGKFLFLSVQYPDQNVQHHEADTAAAGTKRQKRSPTRARDVPNAKTDTRAIVDNACNDSPKKKPAMYEETTCVLKVVECVVSQKPYFMLGKGNLLLYVTKSK
ncbi:hypothetical protein pdam_00005101 [Pocillopora damicornis]|uniref:ShKT domain-containing protein n=1 Tax=Pocillopora damicornis TaxID=46731 RepID=A0A3M6TNA3_POCDA|nr:hypothetical protein pdam_00005101 [Pocillopora damicornis]